MDCLFCSIINKEKKAAIIYEDDYVMAVLDVFPRSTGHTLVLPKVHSENLIDLSDENMGPVFKGVKKVTTILEKSLGCSGFTIGINHGTVSGQVIDHLHIHIIPRWEGDGGGSIHSVVNNPPQKTIEDVQNLILKNSVVK